MTDRDEGNTSTRAKPDSEQPNRALREGDTYAVPVSDGRYGAVRVLRLSEEEGGPSALVALTSLLQDAVPAADDPALRTILRRFYGQWNGQHAICWYSGKPLASFVLIGTIAPTDEELSFDAMGAYCGRWHLRMAEAVLISGSATAGSEALSTPTSVANELPTVVSDKAMSDEAFWTIIALLDAEAFDEDGVVAPAIEALTELPTEDIAGFARTLSRKLFALDRLDVAMALSHHAYESEEGFSPDHFLDVRCAIVAKGRQYYENILRTPTWIDADAFLESLSTVAEDAYFRKTGHRAEFGALADVSTFGNVLGWRAGSE